MSQSDSDHFESKIRTILWPIKRYELAKFIPMATLMFCVLFNQNILRILKDSILISEISAEDIDNFGIQQANLNAMVNSSFIATKHIDELPHVYVIDQGPKNNLKPQIMIPKADSTSLAVAAASIIAKVTHDRILAKIHEEYPEYDLINNKYYQQINELIDDYMDKWKIRPSNLKRYLQPGSERFTKFLHRNNLKEVNELQY